MSKLFDLGRVWVMQETTDALSRAGQTAAAFLDKHASEDWGTFDPQFNEEGLRKNLMVVSHHQTQFGDPITIVTSLREGITWVLSAPRAPSASLASQPQDQGAALGLLGGTEPSLSSLLGFTLSDLPSELAGTGSNWTYTYDSGSHITSSPDPFGGVRLGYQYEDLYSLTDFSGQTGLIDSAPSLHGFVYDSAQSRLSSVLDISTPWWVNITYDPGVPPPGPGTDAGAVDASASPPAPPRLPPPTPPPG